MVDFHLFFPNQDVIHYGDDRWVELYVLLKRIRLAVQSWA